MTQDHANNTLMLEIFESLNAQDPDSVRQVLETLYNGVMRLEREQHLRAAMHERSAEREGYANGYKNKTLNTRMGALKLNVPQTRDTEFYPACLEKGCRSERALKLAVAEMYIKGVSTRKVAAVTEKLCGLDVSSTQVSALAKVLDEEFAAFRDRKLGLFPLCVSMNFLYHQLNTAHFHLQIPQWLIEGEIILFHHNYEAVFPQKCF